MVKRWVKAYMNYAKGNNLSIADEVSTSFLFGFTIRRFVHLIRGYLRSGTICFLDTDIRFVCKRNLKLGKNVFIGRITEINCLGIEPTLIGEGSSLGSFGKLRSTATFYEMGQGINIGNYVGIGDHFYLGGFGGIKIGENWRALVDG